MPRYDVHYVCSISDSQKASLAEAITELHTKKFSTPSLFVNVCFTNTSGYDTYVGGKRRAYNCITATVRPGGGRNREAFNDLIRRLQNLWNGILNGGKKGSEDTELRVVFILATISAGLEAGFILPAAGEDEKWLRENKVDFHELAKSGDTDMQELVQELRLRKDLQPPSVT